MSKRRKMTRREFLNVSALATAGAVVAACGGGPEPTPEEKTAEPTKEPAVEKTEEPSASGYSEAPGLAALVKAGDLPPIDERLPLEPFVVGPGVRVVEEHLDWEVGQYSKEGEVLRAVTTNPTWSYPCQHALESFLNTPVHHTGPITGNLCSSWSHNDDLTEYTFTLRKGLKWSDGVAVTTDDMRFVWEDIVQNEEVTPTIGSKFRTGGTGGGDVMDFEIVDDFTFKCTFSSPTGRFLKSMGMSNLWEPYCFFLKPKHYLSQFHKDYVSEDELKAVCEAEGVTVEEWNQVLGDKGANWWGGGCEHLAETMPVLRGWIVKESPEELIIMERNPYYWKVDTEGKQLPYVDRIEGVVVASPENIPASIIAGEGNYQREILKHTDIALYKEHEAENDWKLTLDMVYHNAPVALFFNFNNMDEAWREITWNKDFRHAINAALDYTEIIDVLFLGMGEVNPWIPDVNDKDEANKLLDKVGLDKRDADGWRLYPNGERFELRMDVATNPLFIQPAEIIKVQLEEVGISVPLKQLENSLWNELRNANELFASINWLDDCNWPYIKHDYTPNTRIRWGQLWHRWIETKGEEGEEPPDWMQELYALDAEMGALNPNTPAGADAEKRFAAWFLEYVPLLPLARDVKDPCIVPKNLGNVAHAGRSSAVWFGQEQVFFKS